MATFTYVGRLRTNSAISGTVEAEDTRSAMAELSASGITVTSLAPAAAMLPSRPLSRDDFFYFNQQLASLAETGVALDKGLRILAKDIRRGRLRKAVDEIVADLERGTPLEEAINLRAGLFPPLYGEILKSGVENNRLGTTLCNLNTHLLLMQNSRRLFWESAIYPLIVAVLGIAVLSGFMIFVVPQQEELVRGFVGMGYYEMSNQTTQKATIPFLTQLLFSAARHWTTCLAILGGCVGALLVLLYILKLFSAGRRVREALFSLVPGFYGAYKASILSRFSQAAALGASAGHDLPRVLRLAAGATGHEGLIREAEKLSEQIEKGAPPDSTGVGTKLIPAIFGFTAQIAGRRGQLASALAEMARAYEAIARHRILMMRMILTPILLIITAVLLGSGIAVMFYPLTTVMNSLTSGM